jgi:hypothetical protein
MGEKAKLPLYKINVSLPIYYVDDFKHFTGEELDKKVKELVLELIKSEPETVIGWMEYTIENGNADEIPDEELHDKVRFSAEYVLFLNAMMDAGVVDRLKDEDNDGLE